MTFSVIVTPDSMADAVEQLLEQGAITHEGIARSLMRRLATAGNAWRGGDCATAERRYGRLLRFLARHTDKHLTGTANTILSGDIQYLIAHCA